MLESNIWKYAVFLVLNKRVYVAILGVYYLSIVGVTAQTIGLLLLIGSLAGFIFEIPSGYISDKMGHKRALVFSRVLMLISTSFFLFADNATWLILGSAFLSISFSFISGTGSAFMHETLRGLNRENDYAKVMGKISAIGFAIPVVLMVLTPFMVEISFKAPFVVAWVLDIIGLIVAISFIEPKVSQEHIDEVNTTNFKQVIVEGQRLGFFKFALLSAFIGGLLFAVGGFRAPYQEFTGAPIIYFGIFFGIGRAFASLMLAYSGKIKELFANIVALYRFKIVIYGTLITILGLTTNPWVVVIVFVVINAFQWGLSQVSTGFMLEIIKNSKFKATLLSAKSQINQLTAAGSGFTLGLLIENFSYQLAFLYFAMSFIIITLVMYYYVRR